MNDNMLLPPSKIFVTGASGFIGTKLVNALLAQGHSIYALVRPSSNCDGLMHERIACVQGDIADAASLREGMRGCRYVFHLAAYSKNWAPDRRIFFTQNVDGMRNVFHAAKDTGVERVVFTSTIVTFGPTAPGVIGDETMPRITPKHYTEYEESKTVAEQEALRWAAEGFPVVLVNPTRVYGPGKLTEGNTVSRMIDMYDRGKLPVLLNGGRNVANYVFVDDLVDGLILALANGRIGERYILGGENISLKGFHRLVDDVSGKRHLQFGLPPALAMASALALRTIATWFGRHPLITPGWVKTFLQDWAYSCAKAERELGYRITPLREGIRRTYEWIIGERERRKERG